MSDDAMVPIAELVSRSEALTVAAILDAAGIIVHVGGEYYASTMPHILAIGGFRLTVPAWQYDDASAVLTPMLAELGEASAPHMRRAVGRFAAATMISVGAVVLPYMLLFGAKVLLPIFLSPLMLLQLPVNPSGRGDYYLSSQPR